MSVPRQNESEEAVPALRSAPSDPFPPTAPAPPAPVSYTHLFRGKRCLISNTEIAEKEADRREPCLKNTINENVIKKLSLIIQVA